MEAQATRFQHPVLSADRVEASGRLNRGRADNPLPGRLIQKRPIHRCRLWPRPNSPLARSFFMKQTSLNCGS